MGMDMPRGRRGGRVKVFQKDMVGFTEPLKLSCSFRIIRILVWMCF